MIVAGAVVVTAATVAVNVPVVCPDAIVILDGTVTEVLLLDTDTTKPPVPAGFVNETKQGVEPAPVNVTVEQDRPLNVPAGATPVPLNGTWITAPDAELLVKVTVPVSLPATVGLNPTFKDALPPGCNTIGKAKPEIVNPVPETAAELMVTGAFPDDSKVRACDVGLFI